MIKQIIRNMRHHIGMATAVLLSACTWSCTDSDEAYLVRETDNIYFSNNLTASKSISLRCNGNWHTVTPDGAEWITVTPAEGTGDGSFTWIEITTAHNRGVERSATIYLEMEGRQYPITVSQPDGSVKYSDIDISGSLIEGDESAALLTMNYSNAFGDETVNVQGTISGNGEGLTVQKAQFNLNKGSGSISLEITGTPTTPGTATFSIIVDGTSVGTVSTRILNASEKPVEGLPVKWEFCPQKGTADDRDALRARHPEWLKAPYICHSDVGQATLSIVEAIGKSAKAINSCNFNDGHMYVKGLYVDDAWLFTIPVKNLTTGRKINMSGSIGGSGSSAGFFVIEYSDDNETWTRAEGAKTETFNNTEVTYHARAYDSVITGGENCGDYNCTFPVILDKTVKDGHLYVRMRVSANVRVTANNTITNGGGGSTRLKGTIAISLVEDL